MIAKIKKGSDFSGLANYLTRDGRGQVLELRGLSSADASEAAGEMELQASISKRTQKPVMHISVSYAKEDGQISDIQMKGDAREILKELGLDKNQAVIIRHDDSENAHFHIMVNRVSADGRAVSDSKSYAKTEASLRRIEARRGLRAVEGRHAASPDTGARMTGGAGKPRSTAAHSTGRRKSCINGIKKLARIERAVEQRGMADGSHAKERQTTGRAIDRAARRADRRRQDRPKCDLFATQEAARRTEA